LLVPLAGDIYDHAPQQNAFPLDSDNQRPSVPELSFGQQIWLAVLDKLALGGALAGVGFVANKYLESHKVRRAFAAEVAKQRLAAITEIWHDIGEYEIEAYRATGRGLLIILDELRKAGAKVPDPFPRDTQQIVDAIAEAKDQVELPHTSEARLDEWLAENARTTHEHVDRVLTKIAAKRFIVGDELARRFERYLETVHTTYRQLRSADRAHYPSAHAELRKLRTDLERTSKEVFG
jgi:hypothetical protein